MQILPIPCT